MTMVRHKKPRVWPTLLIAMGVLIALATVFVALGRSETAPGGFPKATPVPGPAAVIDGVTVLAPG